MERLLFILPALPEYEPYVQNYFKIAEDHSVEYDVVCWNRKGEEVNYPANYTVYQHPTCDDYSPLKKISEIFHFYRFVKKVIKKNNYRCVFTYTIADSLLFAPYLRRHYRGRYVFDIRDHSPIISSFLIKPLLNSMLKYSACNVISSAGYKKWLPKQYEYILCHNTDILKVRNSFGPIKREHKSGPVKILTIGAIRDFEANKIIADVFSNKANFITQFVGDGDGAKALVNYCRENNINNVEFYGKYLKSQEDDFVKSCDFINITLPRHINSSSTMANRFYLSVRFRKPMFVNSDSFQAEQVEKYGLGIVVSNPYSLYDDLVSYLKDLNWEKYDSACSLFLHEVSDDMERFSSVITKYVLGDFKVQ